MASKNKSIKKRKSAGLGDIFEVSDKDLSPEPEEPEKKVLKTRDSDVSESRRTSEHNLTTQVDRQKNCENINETQKSITIPQENIETIDILDTPTPEKVNDFLLKDSPVVASIPIPEDVQNTPTDSNIHMSKDVQIESQTSVSVSKTGEIFTVVDDDESVDDVIMVCDSSIDCTKENITLSSPVILHDDTLEDGEVNENDKPLEELDTSVSIPSPTISIKFNNKTSADLYKHKFLKFIQSFVELELQQGDNMTINVCRDGSLDPKEWVVLDNTVCIPQKEEEEELAQVLPATPKQEHPKKKKKKKKQIQQATELFIVDTTPGTEGHKTVQTKYSTKFLINDAEKQDEEKNANKAQISATCFNCEESHSLKDCPHPKNFKIITMNRKKFQNNKTKTGRYHLEEDQKYSHFVPGTISPSLRNALGLTKNQMPSYIYQMRMLGYPPGWLEDAKFVSSDLAMFDIDGKNVRNTMKTVKGLDAEKIIEYPGFNAPFKKDFRDEYKFYRAPPFSNNLSKEKFIEAFMKMSQREEDNFETQDMDVDDAEEDLSEENTSLKSKHLDFSVDSDSHNDPSVSLQELQRQKYSLLQEIKKSEEVVPWDISEPSKKEVVKVDVKNEENVQEESKTEGTTLEIKISSEENECASPSTSINCVKTTSFGTPILKSASLYNKLPDPDNFTKGVSPVIDYENLPNSTGKYEQMTGVLQKVRNTLKNLQKSKT